MSMKYIAAYALASLAHPSPSQSDVAKICQAVGIDVDVETLSFVLESIDGRDVATLIAEGASKMSSMSAASAGAAVSSGAAASAAGSGAAAPAAADAGKAKKEEPAEEEDDDMGFGLFD